MTSRAHSLASVLVAIGVLLPSLRAHGQYPTAEAARIAAEQKTVHFDFYLLDREMRFQKSGASEVASHADVVNFAIGGRLGATSLLLEYGKFSNTTGNATLSIASSRQELIAWWKQAFYNLGSADLFATAGLGAYQEQVKTNLTGTSVTDTADPSAMAGFGVGVSTLFLDHFLVSLEGRALFGANFDPNPEPGILFRAGFEF